MDCFETEKIKFYNCDYKDILHQLTPKSIDLILTDPPYNISVTCKDKVFHKYRLDFGGWDYNFDQQEWINLSADFVKDGGTMIIFNAFKNLNLINDTLEKQGFTFKALLRLEKNNSVPRSLNRRYVYDCEYAVYAVKGEGWTFNNPSGKLIRPKLTTNVQNINTIHPTQKPLRVFEELVLRHSNANDLICDFFSGSATTAIACIKHNRRFIGTEQNKEYFKKALERIKNALQEPSLFYEEAFKQEA